MCENVGICTALCVLVYVCVGKLLRHKSPETMQIITIDAFVTKPFSILLQYARKVLRASSFWLDARRLNDKNGTSIFFLNKRKDG